MTGILICVTWCLQFYHACDEDFFSFCMMTFEVLQFCDFYSAILSFWVTLIAMANLPPKFVSVAHMVGALGIALGVEYERTGLWVFVVPVGTGVIIMMISWVRDALFPLLLMKEQNLSMLAFCLPTTVSCQCLQKMKSASLLRLVL